MPRYANTRISPSMPSMLKIDFAFKTRHKAK